LKKRRRDRQRNTELVAAAVCAATTVGVVGAGGEVGVVIESVSANVGVVPVRQELLHFPVVRALADGKFEIFLGDGIPELSTS
jgi:hypothetical protein